MAVVESWDWEVPSTKDASAALPTLGLDGRVLVVLAGEDERAYKSFRNLPGVDLVLVRELAAYDVLCSDWVVFTRATLPGNSSWGEAPPAPPLRRRKPERTEGHHRPEAEAEQPKRQDRRSPTRRLPSAEAATAEAQPSLRTKPSATEASPGSEGWRRG